MKTLRLNNERLIHFPVVGVDFFFWWSFRFSQEHFCNLLPGSWNEQKTEWKGWKYHWDQQKDKQREKVSAERWLNSNFLKSLRLWIICLFFATINFFTLTTFSSKKSNVQTRVFQCSALNGGIFLLSILLFDYGLMPLLQYIVQYFMGQSAIW